MASALGTANERVSDEWLAAMAANAVGVTPASDMRLYVEQAVKWALQQRRASVVSPEMVERAARALCQLGTSFPTIELTHDWVDRKWPRFKAEAYAALTATLSVSHETGDGETKTLPERCPECSLHWGHNPPALISGSDQVRCIECKSVFPAPTDETQGVKREAVAWRPEWPADDAQVVFDETNGETGRVWNPHRGYWAYKTATALACAEARIRELEFALTTAPKGMDEEVLGFVFAILGADTWLEAGAIWDGNPEQRKAAHTALSQQTGSDNDQ